MTDRNPLTKEQREEISKAMQTATPGPWEVINGRDIFTPKGAVNAKGVKADDNDGWHIADTMCGPAIVNGEEWEMGYTERYANTHLIANSPTWLQQYEDTVQALEDRLAKLTALLENEQQDLTDLLEVHKEDYHEYQAKLKALEEENERLRGALAGSAVIANQSGVEIKHLHDKLKQIDAQRMDAEADRDIWRSDYGTAQQEIAELEAENERLKKEVAYWFESARSIAERIHGA